MIKIKVKEIAEKTIKSIDKSIVVGERLKDTIVYTKTKVDGMTKDSSPNESSANKIEFTTNRATDEIVYGFNKHGKKSVKTTKKNLVKSKIKVKEFRGKLSNKRKIKKINKKFKVKIKNVNKSINNGKRTFKVARKSIDNSKKGLKLAKESTKKVYQGIKLAIKATVSAVKGIIAATKGLFSLIFAGGWIVVLVIIFLLMIGLLLGSIFGIFFSSENIEGRPMNSVIKEINQEMANKILQIQNENTHDDYVIESNRADWREVLAIYAVTVANDNKEMGVITLNDDKIKKLKEIFWQMNTVTFVVKTEKTRDLETNKDVSKNILYINITSKSVEEMMTQSYFTLFQKNQVKELLDEQYKQLWASVIYGTSIGNPDMVQIALSQVGNVGGETFWRWYGFKSRVEWCAIFVSWVANEAGYIDSGIIPKFAGVGSGIGWFKAIDQWKEAGFIPSAGDIIFFDWENDGKANHVGIVEKVENGKVYTVEGNSTDDGCRQQEYTIDSNVIFGYGTPVY